MMEQKTSGRSPQQTGGLNRDRVGWKKTATCSRLRQRPVAALGGLRRPGVGAADFPGTAGTACSCAGPSASTPKVRRIRSVFNAHGTLRGLRWQGRRPADGRRPWSSGDGRRGWARRSIKRWLASFTPTRPPVTGLVPAPASLPVAEIRRTPRSCRAQGRRFCSLYGRPSSTNWAREGQGAGRRLAAEPALGQRSMVRVP